MAAWSVKRSERPSVRSSTMLGGAHGPRATQKRSWLRTTSARSASWNIDGENSIRERTRL